MLNTNMEKTTEELWEEIPHHPLGEAPEGMPDREYRTIVAKRAIVAAYEADSFSPEELVCDILADLRHLCDKLGLDFAERDAVAYEHYSAEIAEWNEADKQQHDSQPQHT